MPAPPVGWRFGIQKILLPAKERCRGMRVLGISGSCRQQSAMSKTERHFLTALQPYRDLGCTTAFLRLKDLIIHDCEGNYSKNPAYCTSPCKSTLKYEDDKVQKVCNAVLGFHVPEVSIASWVGENDEDTMKEWEEIQQNRYTQKDMANLIYSSKRLAVSLKVPCEANADSQDPNDQGGSW